MRGVPRHDMRARSFVRVCVCACCMFCCWLISRVYSAKGSFATLGSIDQQEWFFDCSLYFVECETFETLVMCDLTRACVLERARTRISMTAKLDRQILFGKCSV